MIVLDTLTKLEAILAAAITTSQPEVHVSYFDWNVNNERTAPATFRAALNSANDVTILAAPTTSPRREVSFVSIYNKDTASVTVTIKSDDGTERILVKQELLTTETLSWTETAGWFII